MGITQPSRRFAGESWLCSSDIMPLNPKDVRPRINRERLAAVVTESSRLRISHKLRFPKLDQVMNYAWDRDTHYLWDRDTGEVRSCSFEEWATSYTKKEARVVQQTHLNGCWVSTVFLGIDHNFFDYGAPLLFETMIFGGVLDQEQWRYPTQAWADLGHEEAVNQAAQIPAIRHHWANLQNTVYTQFTRLQAASAIEQFTRQVRQRSRRL